MTKPDNYSGTIEVVDGISPAGLDYPVMHAHYVQVGDEENKRLDAELEEIKQHISDAGTIVDDQLSAESTNPVQNKVIHAELEKKQDMLPHIVNSSTPRSWVVTPTQYNPGTGKETGVLIGTAKFNAPPILKDTNSPIITNIAALEPASDALSTCAILARVAELYTMDNTINPDDPYSNYIKAIVDGNAVKFYWTYPYFFKRVIGETGGSASSGPGTGIVTLNNYFNKWSKGEINTSTPYTSAPEGSDKTYPELYNDYLKDYYRYHVCGKSENEPEPTSSVKPTYSIFSTSDNGEPYSHTFVIREPSGCITIESSDYAYHAVNNKKLNAVVGKEISNVNANITAVARRVDTVESNTSSYVTTTVTGTQGKWYTIAKVKGSKTRRVLSNLRIEAFTISGADRFTQISCVVSAMRYSVDKASIGIITYDTQRTNVITAMRIMGNPSKSDLMELQIYIAEFDDNPSMIISVERGSKHTLNTWDLVEPTIKSELAANTETGELTPDEETSYTRYAINDLSTAPILGRNVATKAELEEIKSLLTDLTTRLVRLENATFPKLATPTIKAISDSQETYEAAYWDAVENASGYRYIVYDTDGETIVADHQCGADELFSSRPICVGQSIKVMAIGDGINYLDSEWSDIVRRTIKLATPIIFDWQDPLFIWYAVENASGYRYIVYDIDGETVLRDICVGADTDYGDMCCITENPPKTGQYIKIMALGDDVYSDSDWSEITRIVPRLSSPPMRGWEGPIFTWYSVSHAVKYQYIVYDVDGETVLRTNEIGMYEIDDDGGIYYASDAIDVGQSIKVMAISNGIDYLNSMWSEPVTRTV